jgi:hypothetical protein
MLRYTLLVILRSILAVVLLFALFRLLRRTWRSFWEGLRGTKEAPPVPQGRPTRPKVEYQDLRDASFKEEKRPS